MKKKLDTEDTKVVFFLARQLACRFYAGTQEKTHNVKNMAYEDYLNKSFDGWCNTARGILTAINNSKKWLTKEGKVKV